MLDVRGAMRRSARFHRDLIAIRSGDRELTYGQAWERGLRLANALAGLGLAPGDRVAVLEDNCVEAVFSPYQPITLKSICLEIGFDGW